MRRNLYRLYLVAILALVAWLAYAALDAMLGQHKTGPCDVTYPASDDCPPEEPGL
jgi:hypothetical protein